MRAVTWHGKRDVRVETVPDPTIKEPTDAIVRITSTGMCGSDLHLYEVMAPFMTAGDILGHEPMGIVEAVGAGVTNIEVGRPRRGAVQHLVRSLLHVRRRVCSRSARRRRSPSTARARRCSATRSSTARCPAARPSCLRVPQAQFGPIKVPEGPPDDRFLYLSDVLPTAWQAVRVRRDARRRHRRRARPRADRRHGVPRSRSHRGAGQVIGIDLVPERLERAGRYGVETLDLRRASTTSTGDAIRELHRRSRPGRRHRRGRHGGPRLARSAKLAHTLAGCCPTASPRS